MEITYDEIDAMCWRSLKKSMERFKENPTTYEIWKTIDNVISTIEDVILSEAKKSSATIVKDKKEIKDGMRWNSLKKSLEEIRDKRTEDFEKYVKVFYNLMKNLESL